MPAKSPPERKSSGQSICYKETREFFTLPSSFFTFLESLVSLTSDYVELLLACQVDELNSVTTYTDGEVLVLFLLWVLHSILELVDTEYVHVQVVRTLVEVTIQYTYQCLGTLLVVVTQSARTDGLSIRDTIESILVWQLSY